MIRESVTLEQVTKLLNEMLELDREATTSLVNATVPCNKQVADHPEIQAVHGNSRGSYEVGLLGVLNGLFGNNGVFGAINAVLAGDVLVRFEHQTAQSTTDSVLVCPYGHTSPFTLVEDSRILKVVATATAAHIETACDSEHPAHLVARSRYLLCSHVREGAPPCNTRFPVPSSCTIDDDDR